MRYWMSTNKATGLVTTYQGVIVETPPIWSKFKGQETQYLIGWLRKQPGFTYHVVYDDDLPHLDNET